MEVIMDKFKQYLISIGVSEDQADKVISGMPEQKFYLASEEHLDDRYAKLKEQKEQLDIDITAKDKLVSDLQKTVSDNADAVTQIDEYKTAAETAQAKQAEIEKTYAVKSVLAESGAKDVDYAIFKLGGVEKLELNKDGSIKGLENQVKSLKESNPDLFQETKTDDSGKAGYHTVDNGLEGGKGTPALSMAEVKNMSTEEINANWDAVQAAMTNENEGDN